MNYNVLTIAPFDKQLKKLVKKYPSLKVEIASLISQLKTEPGKGTALGNECYKYALPLHQKVKVKVNPAVHA